MRTLPMNKKVVASLAAGLIVATAGGAYAYWTTTGDGTGSATTGTSSAFVVTTDPSTGSPLSPGGPTQTVAFHVQNTNSGVQNLSAVAVSVAGPLGVSWTSVAGCSSADYTVGTPAFTPGDIASGSSRSGTVTITMIDRPTVNQDGCKLATVPLYVHAS